MALGGKRVVDFKGKGVFVVPEELWWLITLDGSDRDAPRVPVLWDREENSPADGQHTGIPLPCVMTDGERLSRRSPHVCGM